MRALTAPRHRPRRAVVSATALATLVGLGGVSSATAASGRSAPADSSTRAVSSSSSALAPFTLVSPDFRDGGALPVWTEFGGTHAAGARRYGKNLAPELDWHNAPSGTAGYALLVNDMDAPIAGGWHHWVVYDIPGGVSRLKGHGVTEYTQGSTSWDVYGIPVVGWGGPCPPADGQTHPYLFTLYALSTATLTA